MRRLGRGYLTLQGGAVAVWWIGVALSPSLSAWFTPLEAPPSFLYAFFPGDLLIVAGGSLLCAYLWQEDSPPRLILFVAGALWYTTLYLASLWFLGEIGATAFILMTLASLGTTVTASVGS